MSEKSKGERFHDQMRFGDFDKGIGEAVRNAEDFSVANLVAAALDTPGKRVELRFDDFSYCAVTNSSDDKYFVEFGSIGCGGQVQ